jgi:ERCC4-related helicase
MFASPLADIPGLNRVTVPDLWQQQAVAALRDGKDVVVQAPTGSGKTLIFELWSNLGKNRGQAIYTVPTRALANDKLAEWRARGWNVGIATGDLAENLNAPSSWRHWRRKRIGSFAAMARPCWWWMSIRCCAIPIAG